MYAKPHLRRGLLGRMLKELLETRVMVKQSMKGVKDDKARHAVALQYKLIRLTAQFSLQALRRVLDARQLGLKFISNVTYGYTSATFSGRMPAVEIADSIVQSGRETLEKVRRFHVSSCSSLFAENFRQ
jgi:DNA polymerase zeta